jgi:hypothetical protein
MKKLPSALFVLWSAAAAAVDDDQVATLHYATNGVKDVYYARNNPAATILHHIRAFAQKSPVGLGLDYRHNSTLTFGPVTPASPGNTYEAAGVRTIQETFEFFFIGGGLPAFTDMTITSASRIGNQFYQTFQLTNGPANACIGSDTFLVTGNTISRQTAFVVCD